MNFRFASHGLRKALKIGDTIYFYRENSENSASKAILHESYLFRFFDELYRELSALPEFGSPEAKDIFAEYIRSHLPGIIKSPSTITPREWLWRIRPVSKNPPKKLRRYYWQIKTRFYLIQRASWRISNLWKTRPKLREIK